MKYKVVIKPNMPNLNDFLKAERTTLRTNGKLNTKGNLMKKEWQKRCVMFIRLTLKGKKLKPPVDIHYHYFEKDKRRDKGNIHAFCQKVFEDALQQAGTLPNDGWNEIRNFSAEFDVDKNNPRVEITITEVD